LEDPKRHFSYPMHVAKELSGALHHENIRCVDAGDKKLQLRLRFYEITQCNAYRLESQFNPYGKKVTISYINTPIYETYVTKVNKK
jgi:hypothetical protein